MRATTHLVMVITLFVWAFSRSAVAAPIPRIDVLDFSIVCHQIVSVHGRNSEADPGHEIVAWEWDLDGDERPDDFGPNITFIAHGVIDGLGPGRRIGLTVVDDTGSRASIHRDIPFRLAFGNLPPIAALPEEYFIEVDATGERYTPIFLDGSNSSDENGLACDRLDRFAWDTDDDGLFGTDDPDGPGLDGRDLEGPTHFYVPSAAGRVGLKVCDFGGLCTEEYRNVTEVPHIPPMFMWNPPPSTFMCRQPAHFSLNVFWPGEARITVESEISGVATGQAVADLVDGWGELDLVVNDIEIPQGRQHRLTLITREGVVEHRYEIPTQFVLDEAPPGGERADCVLGAEDRGDWAWYDEGALWGGSIERLDGPCPLRPRHLVPDMCGNVGEVTMPARLRQPPEFVLTVPSSPVPTAQVAFEVPELAGCEIPIIGSLSRNGGPAVPFAGGEVREEGRYLLRVEVVACRGAPNPWAEAEFVVLGADLGIVADGGLSRDAQVRPDGDPVDAGAVADRGTPRSDAGMAGHLDGGLVDSSTPPASDAAATSHDVLRSLDMTFGVDTGPGNDIERNRSRDDGCQAASGRTFGFWLLILLPTVRARRMVRWRTTAKEVNRVQ